MSAAAGLQLLRFYSTLRRRRTGTADQADMSRCPWYITGRAATASTPKKSASQQPRVRCAAVRVKEVAKWAASASPASPAPRRPAACQRRARRHQRAGARPARCIEKASLNGQDFLKKRKRSPASASIDAHSHREGGSVRSMSGTTGGKHRRPC
ncbi:hypothetical protein BRADI_5g03261v3 [Brachypodium distachyon]|uniref:Uncharacterized protein n=1 Tax=Brachypodium distachyon TaxID=15368 RepID=A0A2K2CF82_BRADI|nr:hypothetical protein BRADI_5g03261v3 [Brachypodium distachyon]PNT60688.1 hypothetical protein BRADI_5g03261v3 [Brachypodium distachyon]